MPKFLTLIQDSTIILGTSQTFGDIKLLWSKVFKPLRSNSFKQLIQESIFHSKNHNWEISEIWGQKHNETSNTSFQRKPNFHLICLVLNSDKHTSSNPGYFGQIFLPFVEFEWLSFFMHSSNGICHSTRKSFPVVLVSNGTSECRKHDKKLEFKKRIPKIKNNFFYW